jgi:DNA helicase II / ATP-dependent DNA helicase PcrA
MKCQELLDILFPLSGSKRLTEDQQNIVKHPNGPAWVLAGPGSGKTEVLTVLVLRLLYVENDPIQQDRVSPESIVVTTFTEKAARNLEDRISQYRAKIVAAHPQLSFIDVSKLRIGTLHALCNDLLQEFRAPNYQNVRLMDEFEQALFVREHMSLIKQPNTMNEIEFWKTFPWLFRPNEWKPDNSYAPNRWNSTRALVTLLNRLVEDRVSIEKIKAAGGQLANLADLYNEYVTHLDNNYRCDFSQLQDKFLTFLKTPLGQSFLSGDTKVHKGIQWVLVDEYQDTNPIQEEIYFELAKQSPHNLVVVGDDDQAMYRFRGGSVECMVTFADACNVFINLPVDKVARYPLVDNFRSHQDIVSFFNGYIESFTVLQTANARVPKPSIRATKKITEVYPAVGRISAAKLEGLAEEYAETVKGLVESGVVNDPNECCLLLKSTRETPMNAGKYVAALQSAGLNVYNPRNKAFADQEEVQGLIGAILAVLDPNRRFASDPSNKNIIPKGLQDVWDTFDRITSQHSILDRYIKNATFELSSKPGQPLDANLQELAYYLLSLDPFSSWQDDPVRRVRLGKLTKLLEAYSSMPVLDPDTGKPRERVTRGFMRSSETYPGEVNSKWLASFYILFIGYVLNAGFDDEEDEDVIAPSGMVPIMTMHQSKGLEFPFVFVGHLGESPKVSPSHELESLFSLFPANQSRTFLRAPAQDRAEMDMIRQYYVAYSRAKYALILLGTNAHFAKKSVPLGPEANWVKHQTNVL